MWVLPLLAAYMRDPTTIVQMMNGVSAETSTSVGQVLGTSRFRRLYASGPCSQSSSPAERSLQSFPGMIVDTGRVVGVVSASFALTSFMTLSGSL